MGIGLTKLESERISTWDAYASAAVTGLLAGKNGEITGVVENAAWLATEMLAQRELFIETMKGSAPFAVGNQPTLKPKD